MKSFRNVFVFAFAAVLAGTLALAVDATHSWGNYHWARTVNPFTLKLGDNVSSSWDTYLATASTDWNVSSVLETAIVAGGTNKSRGKLTPRNCVPTSGRAEVCSAKYGANGWLGIASIWVSGSHIVQGTAKMNDTYFNTAAYSTVAWKRLVMCQEIAHAFGLDHQDDKFDNLNRGTCMDYTNAPAGGVYEGFDYGPSNEHPNDHDYEQLGIIYGHNDDTTTVGQTTSSRGNGKAGVDLSDDPKQWGREVKKDSRGRTSLYERDLGQGRKVFTHVFWAN